MRLKTSVGFASGAFLQLQIKLTMPSILSQLVLKEALTFSDVKVVYLALEVFVVYVLVKCTYNRYFHPLANFPGPFFGSLTDWYFVYMITSIPTIGMDLHKKYGMLKCSRGCHSEFYLILHQGLLYVLHPTFSLLVTQSSYLSSTIVMQTSQISTALGCSVILRRFSSP